MNKTNWNKKYITSAEQCKACPYGGSGRGPYNWCGEKCINGVPKSMCDEEQNK